MSFTYEHKYQEHFWNVHLVESKQQQQDYDDYVIITYYYYFGRFKHAASLLKLLTCQYRRHEHIWCNHYRAP